MQYSPPILNLSTRVGEWENRLNLPPMIMTIEVGLIIILCIVILLTKSNKITTVCLSLLSFTFGYMLVHSHTSTERIVVSIMGLVSLICFLFTIFRAKG